MANGLGQYVPQIAAMLLGGLSASLGMPWLLRTARGRKLLLNMKRSSMALFVVLCLGLGGGAIYWIVTATLGSIGGQPELASAPLSEIGCPEEGRNQDGPMNPITFGLIR